MQLMNWSLNKRNTKTASPSWVVVQIIKHKPDLICLVEYRSDPHLVDTLLSNGYFVFESDSSPNGILLAVSKGACKKAKVLYQGVEQDEYAINHVKIEEEDGSETNFIGVRMFSPMEAAKQTPSLLTYLARLSEAKQSFICTGDFNIRGSRMSAWFPGINLEKITDSGKTCLEKNSIVYTNSNHEIVDYGDVDHVLVSDDLTVIADYSWEFIDNHPEYPCRSEILPGKEWRIPKGSPDHAIMIANIERS